MAAASGKRLPRSLEDWSKLPAIERKPGGHQIGAASHATRADPEPPTGGLIANVYIRTFFRDKKNLLVYEKLMPLGGGQFESEPGRDHLWLKREEWRSFMPKDPKAGEQFQMPASVRDRILRYHLLLSPDRVVGGGWPKETLRTANLSLTVCQVLTNSVLLRLDGTARLTTSPSADPSASIRAYHARIYGWLAYDPKKEVFSRFDIVAFGNYWDKSDDWRRSGWLGVAFELANPAETERGILMSPPYLLMREGNDYFGRGMQNASTQ